jgi:hypothetical protein
MIRVAAQPGVEPYAAFLARKAQLGTRDGFEPLFLPAAMKDFQASLAEWLLLQGRGACFADCGLGKTFIELVFAENVVRRENRPVLILTPLSVGPQFVREGEKFGIECRRSLDGKARPGINVTNYEKLHLFDPSDFAAVIGDESGVIKHFRGETQRRVTAFMSKTRYRLLASATPAPNDYIELGTSSEALGHLGRMDMLGTFFRSDEKSLHPTGFRAKWHFRAHAEKAFWRWVASWARALRKPSDMGFSDEGYALPPLDLRETVVENADHFDGELFRRPALSEAERREERRMTLRQRCEAVAGLLDHDQPAVAWCHLNPEGDLIEKLVPGARQVSGSQSDEEKEELLTAFAAGELNKLVTKPTIAGWGHNWQHCRHFTLFPSHSYEQFYQLARRFWRFGQTGTVRGDIVTTEGEAGVAKNMLRKEAQADRMFSMLVRYMNDALAVDASAAPANRIEVPAWL